MLGPARACRQLAYCGVCAGRGYGNFFIMADEDVQFFAGGIGYRF